MFLIRSVRMKDYRDLLKLARELNTVNLPHQPADIKKMIQRSIESFAGKLKDDKAHAQYLFVLEDTEKGRVVGTSRSSPPWKPRKPFIFQVMHEKVSSKTLSLQFLRKFYRFKSDTRGYTEIGGLVINPSYRSHPEKLGKQLSYVRFLFMAAHPGFFKKKVIAELLPPLHREIGSTLYNFYGYRLTRLPYRKADLLSYKNKEFILRLFPKNDLYFDILPPEVQKDIEKTGHGSTVARRLLSQVGFRYANQIDPFDGGPYDVARLKEIIVVRQTQPIRYGGVKKNRGASPFLVLVESEGEARILKASASIEGGKLYLSASAARLLRPTLGRWVYTYPWR
jgi:arginine N-succinyltransferase